MSSGQVFLSLLAGVTSGALIGVLFAPDKGWNTRKRIYKKAEDYSESFSEKFNQFLDPLGEKFTAAKEEIENEKKSADTR